MSKAPAAAQKEPELGTIRAAIWPIHGYEMKKFLPMCFIMFFVLFNYTVLRNMKDALVVPAAGAEVISFLKFWGVTPVSILFVVLYTKLSNVLAKESLFYAIVVPFLVFFAAFAFVIYPNKDFLHPDPQHIQMLMEQFPNVKYFIAIWGVWSYAIFYIMAEMWGTIILTLMFWQFANDITRTNEAKRFYSMFGLIANVSLIFAGQLTKFFAQMEHIRPGDIDSWQTPQYYLISMVVFAGFMIMAIYYWMSRNVLTDPFYYDQAKDESKATKKSKPKMSVGESFKYILSSPYLGFIALLVLGYGVSINLVEVTWKSQVRALYPDPKGYSAFMGDISTWTGVVTMTIILMCKGVVRRFGWLTGAISTPIVIGLTGILFFVFVLFQDSLGFMVDWIGLTPLFLAAFLGGLQNILSKGTKYALFDPTKEMAYIPLDPEVKSKGKAAVDVVGGRLGKSSGGLIQQGLLLATAGTQLTIAPYVAIGLIIVTLAWMWAAGSLSVLYNRKVAEKEAELKA